MNLENLRNSLLLFLCLSFGAHAEDVKQAEGPKPKYVSTTIRLFDNRDYIRKNAAPDFWALMPYYMPQQDGSACGVASLTMFVNAARARQKLSASDALVTQKSLVDKLKIDYLHKGISLDQLGENVRKALVEYGLDANKKATVQVIHADGSKVQNKLIHDLLEKNEKTDHNFILANFFQGAYTGDPEGVGHISPIGAFDAKHNSVLVLDVDREYYEPYWVSFDTFIKGINTQDSELKVNRGIVYVDLQ